MELDLVLESQRGHHPFTFAYTRMVNAGYTGRNQEEVRRHVEDLASKGIPAPESVPVLFPKVPQALVVDASVEVYGSETSGEVEYVLLVVNEDEVYVALGSDHTDRHLEETDIPRSKQICPNVMSSTIWPLDEVAGQWDELVLSAHVTSGGDRIRYQEGRLGVLLNPAGLMDFVKSKVPGPLQDLLIFSGTLGSLTGGFLFGECFDAELVDEHLGRRLSISYGVLPLDYMAAK